LTEVIKVESQLEIFGKLLVLIFTDVLWAELKLALLKAVVGRDESSVEHNSEHHLLTSPIVFENELDVSRKSEAVHLLFSQP